MIDRQFWRNRIQTAWERRSVVWLSGVRRVGNLSVITEDGRSYGKRTSVYCGNHFVLNEIMAHTQSREVRYWRDKREHEIDFVLTHRQDIPISIECKWAASGFSPRSLLAFRRQYPDGENFVVSYDIDRPFTRDYNGMQVKFVDLDTLITEICQS